MPDIPCLTSYRMELFVDAGASDVGVLQHLESCVQCRALAEDVRSNNLLLDDLQHLRPGSPSAPPMMGDGAFDEALPGYALHEEIHRGGQGVVYRATQEGTSRDVAVKVLLQGGLATSRQRRRFEREIEVAAGLRHPNIVAVYDSGRTPRGRHYLAMEFVPGPTLDRHLADRPQLALPERLRLFLEICDAVAHAHAQGVVHRDLKPANVLIEPDGRPRLVDFGLAKQPDGATVDVSVAGEFMGTLAYAAPEHLQGEPTAIDTRSDVYALGLMLYELLARRTAYPTTGPVSEVVRHITTTVPDPPSRWQRGIDRDLDTITLRALAKEPARRYATVDALREDLRLHLAGDPIASRRDSAWYVLRRLARRNRGVVTMAALLLVALPTATLLSVGLYVDARDARDDAEAVTAFLDRAMGAMDPQNARAHGRAITMEQFLAQAEDQLDSAFASRPLVRARLHASIGNSYRALAQFDAAEHHLTAAHDLRREWLGPHDLLTLRSATDLAFLAEERHHPSAAQRLFTDTLDQLLETLPPEHVDILRTRRGLAQLLWRRSRDRDTVLRRERLDGAAAELHAALDGWRHHADPGLEALRCRSQLALVHLELSKLASDAAPDLAIAESELRAVLAEAANRPPATALAIAARGNLGLVHRARARVEEAESAFREALELARTHLGPSHVTTLRQMTRLGRLYASLDRNAEGERYLLDAYDQMDRHWRGCHPDFEECAYYLYKLYREGLGDLDEALHYATAQLAYFEGCRYEEQSPTTLVESYLRVGRLEVQRGDHAEAEAYLATALDLAEIHALADLAAQAIDELHALPDTSPP